MSVSSVGSSRGVVGKRDAQHAATASAKANLLNPPCPHDKTEQKKGKTICLHCKQYVELRGREEIEADIAAARVRHAEELRLLQVELDNLPKAGRGRPKKDPPTR